MSALLPSDWTKLLALLQVFFRLLGLFLLIPGFSHRAIPMRFKVLFALSMSVATYPTLRPLLAEIPLEGLSVVLIVFRETAIGFLMGLVCYLTFEAIHLGAQFIGYQIGFGSVGLIDPVNQSSVSPMVPLQGWVALILMFITDLHHQLLILFFYSFELTHKFTVGLVENTSVLGLVVATGGELFATAIKIAAPFTFLVLASNAAVGILARMLPHMHVILFTFPITILLGIGTLYLLSPEILAAVEKTLTAVLTNSNRLLAAL